VALNGVNSKADCYQVDPVSAFQDLEFATPLWRDLKNATTEEAIQNLQPQDQSSSLFKGKQVMVVPPLVSVTILETKSLLPSVSIPVLSSKFQEFDPLSSTVKACTILRLLLEYLWGVHHEMVPSTRIGIDQSQEGSSKIHLADILHHINLPVPPPFMAPPPLSANPPQDQSSLLSIAGDLRLLRLRLLAVSDETQPTRLADSYIKVLKQSKAFGVTMVLNLGLSMKGCQAEVPLTMANAVKSGNFRAISQLAIHAFSTFNLPYTKASNMANYNKIELDLLLTKSDSVPKEVTKKL
jgi:hypothetical protein